MAVAELGKDAVLFKMAAELLNTAVAVLLNTICMELSTAGLGVIAGDLCKTDASIYIRYKKNGKWSVQQQY